nr:MAG TPA: hypothetical protein [Caudoviricetes sp.]
MISSIVPRLQLAVKLIDYLFKPLLHNVFL